MGASSALMRLIGNEALAGGKSIGKSVEKSLMDGITKAASKIADKEGSTLTKIMVDEVGSKTPSKVRIFTKNNPMSLQEAYEKTASMRNAHASNKRMLTEASGKELYKNFPNDFMELDNSNPYAKKLFGDYDNAISREIGSENASKLRNILGDYARLDNKDFEGSRNMVKNFLNSKDSDVVVNKSRGLLEDAGVYRAHNSPDGISWTTKPSVAMQYIDESLHPDGTKILEGEIHPNNRVIAPQFTERYQPALAQHEVIGDPSGIQQVGKTKMVELLKGEGVNTNDINVANALRYMKPKGGGNYGHKGVKGVRGGSAPKSQQPVDDRMTLYRGLGQEYDPNYPVSRLDTSGYESWTDNPELAKQYGDYVYSIDVPKADIKNSYLDENPNSPTYGDRNPIYMIDKKAGLNGVGGNEYLLEVGSDYQKGLTYNKANSIIKKYLGEPKVNYSLADEADAGLSPAQREFFKDSVVRDENGNLKPLYHGSPNGEFYEFSKDLASPEGDWGKGFYFTDNEFDVKGNYLGGGPDFDNKVAMRAEQLADELDIPYEKAEDMARKEMYKGDYMITAYADMEDPAVVGKTNLFDGSEYGVKPLEDYDNIDDYYADLIYDLSDDVISDTNIDYAYKDDLMRIMSDAYYDGGIGLQELKDKLNELYIEDYDGNLVSNDVARSIIENLGFDGIIDPTVSSKFNMDIEDGTTHYIMFNPEKIKNVDNLNPTTNPDIRYSKGDSLTDIANRIKAMQASRENMSDGIKRIGSDEVAKVDESTLPYGWKYLEKYLDNANLDKELEKAIGKPYSEVTEGELRDFLYKYGGDVAGDKRDLWDNAREVIYTSDMNEMYNRGYDQAGDFLEGRHPSSGSYLTDATKYYIGDKGSTGRLDAEYSDRLGIGRSNTPMSDNLVSSRNKSGGTAAGDYGRGGIGINPKYSSGESGVSVLAHERMHAWQSAKSDGDWDDRVIDAVEELRDELKKYYHTDEELKKFHNIREGSNLDYYRGDHEQEARMLESYLDNEGFTNTWRKRTGSTEWGDEIKPAFDKFYKKLRALSKAGVALPAIALLFGLSANGGEQKDKKA